MLVKILQEQVNFTASESLIANYILKYPFETSNLSASELGEQTFTSRATVFRLIKKIGVANFEELKRQIAIEMSETTRLNELLEQEPFHSDSSVMEVANKLPIFYDQAIHHTKANLDYQALERIVEHLSQASKIDIYGMGVANSLATTAMFRFQSTGKECHVQTSINEHYVMSSRDKKVVALVISVTGCNQETVRIAKYLRKNGVYVVGIAGTRGNDLKEVCDEYLEIYSKRKNVSLIHTTSYFSTTYILDILYTSLFVKDMDYQLKLAMDVTEFRMKN
ncbi:MAG: MurR/RpiR family transcriptional regulator [Streptococcaceae bacterium]|jgi:DNA-binding MurR/RpiR family transcriptional regulator|nr:MurR/RpiR family transcriptional regulator [Streptococcaceae bacterium]